MIRVANKRESIFRRGAIEINGNNERIWENNFFAANCEGTTLNCYPSDAKCRRTSICLRDCFRSCEEICQWKQPNLLFSSPSAQNLILCNQPHDISNHEGPDRWPWICNKVVPCGFQECPTNIHFQVWHLEVASRSQVKCQVQHRDRSSLDGCWPFLRFLEA